MGSCFLPFFLGSLAKNKTGKLLFTYVGTKGLLLFTIGLISRGLPSSLVQLRTLIYKVRSWRTNSNRYSEAENEKYLKQVHKKKGSLLCQLLL